MDADMFRLCLFSMYFCNVPYLRYIQIFVKRILSLIFHRNSKAILRKAFTLCVEGCRQGILEFL